MELGGKYHLMAELGQGGMATVYLAVSQRTSGFRKLAVVKLIRPQFAGDPDLIQMFLDEARLCARLNHPNIVQTYDVGIDNGQYFMAMEYLDGVSLHTALARLTKTGAAFPFELHARALMEVLEALRYAHELTDYDGKSLAIVHRDVTPHNIFITYDGQVKLLDFGIAKAATSSVQTATGIIKGKLTYMAPEQSMCDTIDARADLYAVGVMLWEAVTGRRRWPAGLSDMAAFARLTSGELPESPDAAAVGLPAEVNRIVLKSLAPKREDRYQTAAEMHADLEPIVETIGASSLRDLGTLLQDAFAEDRRRIRQIIEDQFKAMNSRQLTLASEPLPTVHPVRGSDSALHEELGDRDIEVFPEAYDLDGFPDNARKTRSNGTGITGVVTHTGDRRAGASALRWRLLVSAVGILTVAIAASVGAWTLSHRSSDRVANVTLETAPAARTPAVKTPPADPPPLALAPEQIPVRNGLTATPAAGAPVNSAKRRTDGPHVRAPDQKAPLSCSVPFYFDETGIKHVKLECLK